MNPKIATGWQCERCRDFFPPTDRGKAFAEKCCTCSTCGKPSDTYIGTDRCECRACHRVTVEKQARARFAAAKAEMDRLGLDVLVDEEPAARA